MASVSWIFSANAQPSASNLKAHSHDNLHWCTLNSHSWQCEFNVHCTHSNEQLERSDSMWIKGVAILCHVTITHWWTAWKWRPSALLLPHESTLQTCILPILCCPLWLFSGASWCWTCYKKELYHMTSVLAHTFQSQFASNPVPIHLPMWIERLRIRWASS